MSCRFDPRYNLLRCLNFSSDMIRLVVMINVKFTIILRNFENFLFEPSIDICQEMVRLWWNRFGALNGDWLRLDRQHTRPPLAQAAFLSGNSLP